MCNNYTTKQIAFIPNDNGCDVKYMNIKLAYGIRFLHPVNSRSPEYGFHYFPYHLF